MKQLKFMSAMASLLVTVTVSAQKTELKDLTNDYYAVKNAMVVENGAAAKEYAGKFLNIMQAVPVNSMSTAERKVWKKHFPEMKTAGEAISRTADISEQREHLNALSVALFAVLKEFNIHDNPVYYQYCPMKKSFWLSSEKEIKNPYYGDKMLKCGSVKDMIK